MILPNSPSVTIALATYNGERFLPELLDSLFTQSYPSIIQIVSCDDNSTDATVQILKEYAQKDDRLCVHQNKVNLGFVQNFAKAISLSEGDIIFLCDQDDVWWSNKVQRMVNALNKNHKAGFVFANGIVTDSKLKPLGRNVYSHKNFDGMQATQYFWHGRHKRPIGCSMAFRNIYKSAILPIPIDSCWGHDHWIANILASLSSVVYVQEPTFLYRRNSDSAGNDPYIDGRLWSIVAQIWNNLSRQEYEKMVCRVQKTLQRLKHVRQEPELPFEIDESIFSESTAYYTNRLSFVSHRLEMRSKNRLKRIPHILQLYFAYDYDAYARGARTAVKDFLA